MYPGSATRGGAAGAELEAAGRWVGEEWGGVRGTGPLLDAVFDFWSAACRGARLAFE